MNPGQLLDRAKSRLLTRAEISQVAAALADPKPGDDAYTLIHILGTAGAIQHEDLVGKYLHSPSDPMTARIALQTLCNDWAKVGDYRAELLTFVRGVDWDPDDEVRLAAISIAGELLRTSTDKSLLAAVMDIWTSAEHSPVLRQAAYFALARARGADWKDLPPASRLLNLDTDTDPNVVMWATNLLKSQRAK